MQVPLMFIKSTYGSSCWCYLLTALLINIADLLSEVTMNTNPTPRLYLPSLPGMLNKAFNEGLRKLADSGKYLEILSKHYDKPKLPAGYISRLKRRNPNLK